MTRGRYLSLLAGFLACAALGAALIVIRTGDPFAGPEPTGPYVAMGDSYTAGPEIPRQVGTPAGCRRSDHNYPGLVAQALGLTGPDFRDVSCSGATIADLIAPQSTGDGANAPQLDALTGDTRLVTLGIGGNDIGFSAMIERCVAAGVAYRLLGRGALGLVTAEPCRDRYGDLAARIDAAGRRLSTALGEIRHRAPHARVYVVGYPAILPDTGGCADVLPLAPGDVVFLRQAEQRLNAALRHRAGRAGAVYVDTYTPSRGHDVCAGPDARWIEPLLPRAAAAAVHPNERGERGLADALSLALGAV